MALKKTYEKTEEGFSGSLVCNDAYCKIETISGSKSQIDFNLYIYANDKIIATKRYAFTPSVADGSDNFIKQAYLHLKSLPEFAGAVDV
jgi:hypothetical protein